MIRIIKTRPRPPLGPYPQLRLCGQEGIAPRSIKIRITSRTVIMASPQEESW
jgi:hypothetical protein